MVTKCVVDPVSRSFDLEFSLGSHKAWFTFVFSFLLLFIILSSGALAATYYVSPSGSDNNNGVLSAPFKTIQKAANIVNPGDTVMVRGGIYNQRVSLTRSGTSGNYITFQSYPGETVYMDGTGLGNGTMFSAREVSYLKVIGFKIGNHTGVGILVWSLSNYTGSHIEIRDNEIYNQAYVSGGGNAIKVAAWDSSYKFTTGIPTFTDVIIDGNYIHDVVTGVPSAYSEALIVSGNINRFQITNNVIDKASFIGIDMVGRGLGYPHEGIVSGNEVRNSGMSSTAGIYVDGGKNITIEVNIVHDNAGHGISINAEQSGFVTENIIVRKNIVWNNVRNISPGAKDAGIANNLRIVHNTAVMTSKGKYSNYALYAGSGTVLKNNISYITGSAINHVSHDKGTSYTYSFDYNGYYQSSNILKYKGTYYTPVSNWQAQSQDTHGIVQDPLFVEPANRDFRLQSNSPYINAGGFLTTTTSAGSDQTLTVADARYFHDGYGMIQGDLIQVGSNSPVRITAVNYSRNTITVNKSISWNNGDGVSYPYSGSKPDIGAFEYASTTNDTTTTENK